jgi:uncharacterized membrane protein
MGASRWLPVALLVAGAGLVADAVLRGTASVALLVILPVVVGNSAEFLVGVVLLLVGFVTLPFAFGSVERVEVRRAGSLSDLHREAPTAEVGGLVLLGPVPLFFGTWKEVPLWVKLLVALIGLLILAAVLAAVLLG